MNHQMGMTPEMTSDVIKSVTAIGKKFNIGREAIAAMSDTVDMLNENANLLPQNWGPDRMAKFIKGTTIVAGALTKVGFSAEEAIAGSKGLSQALLKGQAGMAALYSGLEDDIPGIADALTQNLGSIGEAVKKLEESPDEFIAGLGKMVDDVGKMNLDSDSMNRFRIQMEKQFGPAAMAVFTKKGFGQIGPAIKEAQKPIEDQANILTKTAGKYSDGRVAADRFAIAQAVLAQKFKGVKGVMSDDAFLEKYKKGTDDVIAGLNKFAAKGGVVGKATQMMVNFHNHGIGGTLGAMHPLGLAAFEMVKQFGPILAMLPQLTMAFKMLLSPIMLVGAAIAGLVFVFRDLAKGDKSIVRPFLDKMVKEAPALFEKIKGVFSQVGSAIIKVIKMIDWAAVGQAVIDGFMWVFNGIFKVIEMIDWAKVGDFLGAALGKVVVFAFDLAFKAIDLIGKMIDWITGLDWGAIGHKVGEVFTGLFALAIDAVVTVVKRLPEIFMMIVNFVIGALTGIEDTLKTKFPEWAGVIEGFFLALKIIAIPVLIAVAGHFALLGIRAVYSAVTTAAAWTAAALQTAGNLGMIIVLIVKIIAQYALMAAVAVVKAAIVVGTWALQTAAVIAYVAVMVAVVLAAVAVMAVSMVAAAVAAGIAFLAALGPIGWIAGAVGAVVAVVAVVADEFSDAGDAGKEMGKDIKDGATAATVSMDKMNKGAGQALGDIKKSSADTAVAVKKDGKDSWDSVSTAAVDSSVVVSGEMEKVKVQSDQTSKTVAKTATDAVKGVRDTASGTTGNVINALLDAGRETIGAAKSIAGQVGNFVALTDDHLKKAGALVFPKLSGDPLLDVAEQYGKVHDRIEALQYRNGKARTDRSVQESEELTKLFGEQDRLNADAMDKFGKNAAIITLGARSASDKFKELGEHMNHMTIEQRDAMQEQIDLSASRYAKEYLDIARNMKILDDDAERRYAQIVKDSKEKNQVLDEDTMRQMSRNEQLDNQYRAQMDALFRSQEGTVAKLSAQADELSKGYKGAAVAFGMNMSAVSTEAVKDWDKWNKAIDTTASVMVIKFKAASKVAAGGFGPNSAAGQAVAAGFDQLNSKFGESMQALKNSGKVGEALKKEMDTVTREFEKSQSILRAQAKKARDVVGDSALQNAEVETFKKLSESQVKISESKNKQISKSNQLVTEGFKLGAGEVAETVSRIAVINPNDFKAGIKTIRETTIKFLEDLDKTGVKLLKDIDANIKKYFESSTKGWNDQEALIKTFSEKAALHIQTYWTKAISEAGKAVTEFTTLAKNIGAGLTAMSKSINIMDLLASPTQIEAWAAAVVSALANAFRGGAAADAMINAAYTKALASASEIAHTADASRPDAGGSGSTKNTSAMQATLSLERSINHPAWAEDKEGPIPLTLKLMNENLTNLLAAMTDFAQGKPVATPPAAPGLRRR
jgi:tape measure domain-containing protein